MASAGLGLALGATTAHRRRFWATVSGSAMALGLVVSAVAFVSALDRLSAEPVRYGVGWELTARNPFGEVPPEGVRALVDGDRDIEAVAGAVATSILVDDEITIPTLAVLPITGDLWPTLVEGAIPRNDTEILAGAAVLDALDPCIGDTVELKSPYYSARGPRVRIAGTAVFPSVDIPGVDPTRLNNGLAMTWGRYQAFQVDEGDAVEDGDRMPDIAFFDLVDGVDPQTVIDRYGDGLPELIGFAATEWLPSLAPLEVVETERAGGLIWTVVGLLGLTVVATIGHGLVAGVRQRRGDYGVLKALGFTRRQVVGAVLWQSTVVVVLALVVALPLGTALGRWAWQTFARSIGVIDTPLVPVLGLVVVAAGALLASGLVAAVPAAVAGRTAPAAALRHE